VASRKPRMRKRVFERSEAAQCTHMCGPLNFSAALCRKQVELFHMMVFVMLFGRVQERNQARKWSSLGVNKFCLYLPHNENNIVPAYESSKGGKPFKKRRTLPKKTRRAPDAPERGSLFIELRFLLQSSFISPPPHPAFPQKN
jgi:hypothetical protein